MRITVNSQQSIANSFAFTPTTNKLVWGFTLIELLVSISIIGLLIGLSTFALQGARKSSRDTRRKADLELIRSGIEIYKADCDVYPSSLPSAGNALMGNGGTSTCLLTNIYISSIPTDSLTPNRSYYYTSPDGETYELCAALEGGGAGVCSGSCGQTCNYVLVNP